MAKACRYQIVGEDEADIAAGRISITSPIARALIGRSEGDVAVVAAPGGERTLRNRQGRVHLAPAAIRRRHCSEAGVAADGQEILERPVEAAPGARSVRAPRAGGRLAIAGRLQAHGDRRARSPAAPRRVSSSTSAPHPGGWSQLAADKVGPDGPRDRRGPAGDGAARRRSPTSRVISPTSQPSVPSSRRWASRKADLVLSDMAPNISGNWSVDQPRSMHLAELALDLARRVLRPGGAAGGQGVSG